MKATILGIGTELVDGQVLNKNATWISEKLKNLGLTTALHLVVPDERKLITEALDFCAAHGDLLFVTGGLGPTTDDFTREVISTWTGLPLKFDEGSWQHIKERLEPRGYIVTEVQRQQCFYPEGATVLKNIQGTANAFFLEWRGKKIFILPGPPREIAAIWEDSIAEWLTKNTLHIDPYITRSWDTLGVGESDVATIAEEVLKDIPVEKGYRVHLPYVEVKISFFKSEEKKFTPYIEKITQALSHCLIARDQQDVAQLFSQALQNYSSVSIQDNITGSSLINRLMPVMKDFITTKSWSFSNTALDEEAQLQLSLSARDENSCVISIKKGQQKFTDILETPYKSLSRKERRPQYFAEMAMIFWLKHL